jgi:hypothetical protein
VGTDERRRLIGVVASEGEPGLHFHNEINVVEVRDPTDEEKLA